MKSRFWDTSKEVKLSMEQELKKLGIELNPETGQVKYTKDFKPVEIKFNLVYVRHGATPGNCGQITSKGILDVKMATDKREDKSQRIFQGDVDEAINQLNEEGKKQAEEAAEKLKVEYLDKGWRPDVILTSPLSRAKDTARPFVEKNNLKEKLIELDEIREMFFGPWENKRVSDFDEDDICHRFYTHQDAKVKSSGTDRFGKQCEGENFCEVLLRAHKVLQKLNKEYAGKNIVMFSHSMFGAACGILLGKGQQIEKGDYLAFDGKRSDGTYYTMPHATPIMLGEKTTSRPSLIRRRSSR